MKRFTKEKAKRTTSIHTVKIMLDKEHQMKMVKWTRAKVAWDLKRQSLRNSLLITVAGDREKQASFCLDATEVGGQTICLQAIPALMTCNDVLEWVGEEVLKDCKNLVHNRVLQAGHRSVLQVGAAFDREAFIDPAGAGGSEGVHDDDNEEKPAETAVCAFVANNLHKGSNKGRWKPLQQGWKKREKKEPCQVEDRSLESSSELILRAASSATGGAPSSNTITGRARSTRPTRRRTRRHTGPRSV